MSTFNYNFITPALAVGQKIDTQEFADELVKAGVTHVINLFSGNPEPFWKGDVLTLKQEDDGTPRPADQVLAGITYPREDHGAVVLYVHCQWGIGRSPAMAYAILRSRGRTKEEAITLINTGRPRAATGGWERYIPSIEEALHG